MNLEAVIKWEAAHPYAWGVGALIMTVHLLDLVDTVVTAVLTSWVNKIQVEQQENLKYKIIK